MGRLKERVFVVGTVGVPANYGGFETLVDNLIEDKSIEWHVVCSAKAYDVKVRYYKQAELHYIPFPANGIGSILYDAFSLILACRQRAECILLLGLSGALLIPALKSIWPQTKFVTNIDGLEWKRAKWGWFARRFLKLSEWSAVRFSDIVLCDNECITDYVATTYKRTAMTVAYGGDHALRKDVDTDSGLELEKRFSDYFLSICRVEPENNVHLILESFFVSGENIIFVGNWSGSSYGRRLKEKYSIYSNIQLLDPVFCPRELFELRRGCKAYVHGHSAGGTNPSLVEIMHFGVPILAYDCNFNRATLDDNGYFFKDLEALVAGAAKGYQLQDVRTHINIAKERYTWAVITARYTAAMQGGGHKAQSA